ncbi:MAG: hypothetical protein ACREXK_04640 [Gammaproteobacteria bacterium]
MINYLVVAAGLALGARDLVPALARISHHHPAATAAPLVLAGRTPSSRLDVVSATPSKSGLASLLTLVVQEGVAVPSTVRIVASAAPPPRQWLCPAVLATLFMAVQMPL